MPALTRSRLDEIRSLAGDVAGAMARGAGVDILGHMPRFAAAVDEVNASLAEIEDLLLAGLRDEAASMHDPELVTVARLLDVRSLPGWLALHGWLLERGQQPPAPVGLDRAEHFGAATEEIAGLDDDLARLRSLALERAPLVDRLAVVRRLRAADPANPAWVEAVTSHEEARIRELRIAVPRALADRDIEALAALAGELADPSWTRRPPADLGPLTAGAATARDIAVAAAEAEAVAAEIARLTESAGAPGPREVDALAARRQRIAELEDLVDGLAASLAEHPRMLEVVRSRGLDVAVRRGAAQVAAVLERIDRMAATLKTRRDFAAACQRLDHLCDHPPDKGGEGQWLADLRRCDLVARAACQEIPDLAMPMLLRERVQRSAEAVESGAQLRLRFRVVMAAAVAIVLAALTGAGVWLSWQRAEYARTIGELERLVAEAEAGFHVERPSVLDRFAGRYAGDARVDDLVETFDAGVATEKARMGTFAKAIADHAERILDLEDDVRQRRTAGEQRWLESWPPSFVSAATALAAARRSGGLPEKRGSTAATITPPTPAARRFQAEEDELATAEKRQATLDGELGTLAQRSFDARLARIQERFAAAEAAEAAALLADLRALRDDATAPKADGLPAGADTRRVPPEAAATLDALETTLRKHDRRTVERKGDAR